MIEYLITIVVEHKEETHSGFAAHLVFVNYMILKMMKIIIHVTNNIC